MSLRVSRLPVKDLLQDLLKRANTDPDPRSYGPRGADADRANLEFAPRGPSSPGQSVSLILLHIRNVYALLEGALPIGHRVPGREDSAKRLMRATAAQ